MAILPTVRCRNVKTSLAFYTGVLDFERVDGDDDLADPSFSALSRHGDRLLLSSHCGDGEFGQVIVVTTDEFDAVFRKFRKRGLRTPGNPDAPEKVHEGPIDQSWSTREFYVDDPDGNTLRFTQMANGNATSPCAAANGGGPSRLQSARLVAAVAELGVVRRRRNVISHATANREDEYA